MGRAGFHGDADKGSREIHATFRHHAPLACDLVEPLAGQDDDVGSLTGAQPLQQRQCRSEIGVDTRAAGRLILAGQAVDGALQRQRREHADGVAHDSYTRCISFSTAVMRRLRLPASAVASSSAPSLSQVPEKPMPTSWPPKMGFSPMAGVCS